MRSLTLQKLKAYRTQTFRLRPSAKIKKPAQALDFVNERGFVYFWPIKNVDLPSLWVAVAGNRPVADAHDDPGHITWRWKDQALGKKTWYYGKVLRRKATLISLGVAPYFYALTENFGSPEEDHLVAYKEGRLTLAAKQVYESLLDQGAMNTIDLRRAARLTSKSSDTEFNRGLEVLQADFKIIPIGVAEAGAWRYAFIYDLVPRHMPELVEKARSIGEAEARSKLALHYIRSVGAATPRDFHRLFGWPPELLNRTIQALIKRRQVVHANHPQKSGEWLALPELTVKE
jgi:Winged helix DNA-binding domain